jgi:predicted nucleotidyltransferase
MDRLVEGCFFEDAYGDLYAVKGVVHPPGRVYAVPRVAGGVKVKDLHAAVEYVKARRPVYLFDDPYTGRVVVAVPQSYIRREMYPVRRATGPRMLVEAAETLAGHIAGFAEDFGFTGSLLTGFFGSEPDIDIVVYGGREVFEGLRRLRAEGVTSPVDKSVAHILLESRADTSRAAEMLAIEPRKVLTGVFKGFLYTLKAVPRRFWESWEGVRCKPVKQVETVLRVVDDSEGFYTPGRYIVEGVAGGHECREVVFFRSRFAESAVEGESVTVRGLLERVEAGGETYHRINVGLNADDFILVHGP